jgi:hypothetical protein
LYYENRFREMVVNTGLDKEQFTVGRKPVWLMVNSFDELMKHEKEIVKAIADYPNGGSLFLMNPIMLFADIGVQLSDEAVRDLLAHQPQLSSISPVPYLSLKSTRKKQKVRFHVHGLFKGSENR